MMADYLIPECPLSVQDKADMFAFRSEINNLPNNLGKKDLCELSCQELMDNEHLLTCVHLNERRVTNVNLEHIRNGNISEKINVLKILQEKTRKRITYINLKMQ